VRLGCRESKNQDRQKRAHHSIPADAPNLARKAKSRNRAHKPLSAAEHCAIMSPNASLLVGVC
jgi:hypothetical protein